MKASEEKTDKRSDVVIARFKELEGARNLYLDTVIPQYERLNYSVVGQSGQNADTPGAPIPADDQWSVEILRCAPGRGAAFHDHPVIEMFMPLTGRWALRTSHHPDQASESVEELFADAWDMVSVAPGVWRSFENVSVDDAYILAMGTLIGFKTWFAPAVVAEARRRGWAVDGAGRMHCMS